MELTAEERERRNARYMWDTRRKTNDPETEGYGYDFERMFLDLEAAERLAATVVAADEGGWLHPKCTGGDCRLAGIRNELIRYRGNVASRVKPTLSKVDPLEP